MINKSDLNITISSSAKQRLIAAWGPEVVLKCPCSEYPSHSMYGQKGSGFCPKCNERCVVINHEWGIVQDGS